jgi:hypothetical protein
LKLNDDNKPYFITEPHLTIARKLQPWQYEKGGWNIAINILLEDLLLIGMLLLKRPRWRNEIPDSCSDFNFKIYQ